MYYSGIDQHKHFSVVTTLAADGERVAQATLANDRRLLLAYFAQWPDAHRAVVEATGRWYWLRDLLRPAGIDLRLAHAKLLKAIAYAKVKTDAIDATTLAQLLRVDLIPPAHMISDALRGPRDVLRTRLQLVERRLRCELTLGSLLEKFNVPEVAQLPPLYQLQVRLQQAQRLLAFTLYLETDDIQRFPSVKHFWGYCRLVPGAADTGGRQRHKTSRDGNRYLKLAFSHAAIRVPQLRA